MVETSTIGLAVALTIFTVISLVSMSLIINPRQDVMQSLGSPNFTISVLILVQFIYLLFHILEKTTQNSKYAVISYLFMIILGGILMFLFLIDSHFRSTHVFAEAVLYIAAGVTLFIIQLREDKKKEKENPKD